MPQAEDEAKDNHVSDSPINITAWWHKFHFSGRVIMCSVLFGLGLVLIGGLIFAINADDETKKNDKNESLDELPTKAPSGYVGPVVMGIGGFIVTVGVIMCLFETQVCRKKAGDTKPLISVKNEDSETNILDSTAISSHSHSHKNHKHKSRKASSSPRKTKSKHTKPYSHEQKHASSISPPISIDKSKSFMTSSEDNFLTPPNTLDEHPVLTNSREVEIQTSSSLMKSFTSSGPSWNQSTEFLTPTASFKDSPISVDNSVELYEKQGQVNFKTNEMSETEYTRPGYMTPLTVEEEKIQKMITQVKNECMKIDKEQSEEKEIAANLSTESGNDTNVINAENGNKNVEDVKISNVNFYNLAVKETTEKNSSDDSSEQALSDGREKSIIINEENTFSSVNNVFTEEFISNKNIAANGSSDMTAYTYKNGKEEDAPKDIPSLHDSTSNIKIEEGNFLTTEKEKFCAQDSEKLDSFVAHASSTSHLNEAKNVQEFNSVPPTEKYIKNNLLVELESSASSEETLVSRDNSIEKPKNIADAQILLSMTEENSSDKSKTSVVLESPKQDQSLSDRSIIDQRNSLTDTPEEEKIGASDLTDNENDLKETNNTDQKSS